VVETNRQNREGETVKGKLHIIAAVVILFAGMCIIENSAVRSKPVDPADNVSSVYKLVGEFRSVFANLLWIKVDCYHHEFIQNDPDWTHNKDLLGLFKMITALDPRFVEAYSTGTYVLMDGYKDLPKALAYLREGLAANPRSYELNELATVLYAGKLHQPSRALAYAKRAVACAGDDYNRGIAKRTLRSVERMIREENAAKNSRHSR